MQWDKLPRALAAAVVTLAALTLPAAADAPDAAAVAKTYADIAEAGYTDLLDAARKLRTAIDTLIKTPTDANLVAARQAWIDARVPYMQTEVFRFGNKIVDDWEGHVNSWPLDEGLIDYVAGVRQPSPTRTRSTRERHRQPVDQDRRRAGRYLEDHARSC